MAAQFIFGCAICVEAFDDQKIVCATICGHVYHNDCLKMWFRTQAENTIPLSCPKCRTKCCNGLRLFLHQINSSDESFTSDIDEISKSSDRIYDEPIPFDNETIDILHESPAPNNTSSSNDLDSTTLEFPYRIHTELQRRYEFFRQYFRRDDNVSRTSLNDIIALEQQLDETSNGIVAIDQAVNAIEANIDMELAHRNLRWNIRDTNSAISETTIINHENNERVTVDSIDIFQNPAPVLINLSDYSERTRSQRLDLFLDELYN